MSGFSLFLSVVNGLAAGLEVTVLVTLASLAFATGVGFLLALVRQFTAIRVVNLAIDAYCEILCNVPALTHLFILYFGLASIGVRLTSIAAAILGLGLIGAAITSSIFRAGFASLPKGQAEASLAAGLTPLQTIFEILTPQAMRIALPALGNYAVQLLKDTSVVSAIAAPEIMFFARSMVTSSFQTTMIYATAAALYLLLSLPLMQVTRFLERRYGRLKG
ncbi:MULTISPECIES: amino acid ABC transporter permease [Rhizobium]|uniref:amino acid ABC transporter permease n=1 Tax=Rhizobium TaxID=379 RepID=UPI000BE8E86F|nr:MULTISPECIES: amino acid ABC transporter permease [Rhizobium]MBY4588189.1 amino acid ABC transporter permease [Rhizobium redzepovicii]MBY4616075.1 amino acid ABC transporter permease [Rhizobium redzepovicii]MDF0660018.1 amino acid ABC transporter permease [Rhizobium sp. BC49]PDS87029.1 ABC transporter permease [Rhizobium sp. L18]TBY44992.1 amino acid ABC transporter permease [Rhizobium leguminosarum bv. viciae]